MAADRRQRLLNRSPIHWYSSDRRKEGDYESLRKRDMDLEEIATQGSSEAVNLAVALNSRALSRE